MDMIHDRSYGFVIAYRAGRTDRFLLVRHADGHWGFPKGHPEGEETPLETAERELREECAITHVTLIPDVTFSETYQFERGGVLTEKTNTFFFASVDSMDATPQHEELFECRFVTIAESLELPLYDNTERILAEADAALRNVRA